MAGQEPKYTTIKKIKSAHDDKSCLSMSASQDIGRIPMKKQKKKASETSNTRNKLTQDQDNIGKEAKVGSSIEGTKNSSVLTPHQSVLTPPPYKNKQDYRGGTNDKTHDSHTRETGVSGSDDYSLARNLDAENKNIEDDEYNDHLSIKNDKIYSQSHEKKKHTIILFMN